MMISLEQGIRQAVERDDAMEAGRIADVLRFKFGHSYEQVCRLFGEIAGLSPEGFESLMYRADMADEWKR